MRKTILITGASSGIGAGMAREFAERGHDLALCARRFERLQDLKNELTKLYGVRISIRTLDVNNYPEVIRVFESFASEFGSLDRIIINAGVGEGRRIGCGYFELNRQTAETNFIAGLAQCEAAVTIFRRQKAGHLVTISSMSAVRGLPRHLTTYAASKAAIAALTEGIRAELLNTPIKVSTILPGFIRTALNEGASNLAFEVSEEVGSKALVDSIEREPSMACVPAWPWTLIGMLMRVMPLRWISKFN